MESINESIMDEIAKNCFVISSWIEPEIMLQEKIIASTTSPPVENPLTISAIFMILKYPNTY